MQVSNVKSLQASRKSSIKSLQASLKLFRSSVKSVVSPLWQVPSCYPHVTVRACSHIIQHKSCTTCTPAPYTIYTNIAYNIGDLTYITKITHTTTNYSENLSFYSKCVLFISSNAGIKEFRKL